MDLNVDDLKKLSLKMKMLIVLLVCILLGYFYYMFLFQGILTKQINLSAKLTDMQQQIVEKERVVAKLDRYIQEVNSLKDAFKVALLKLPNAREIAGLLASVVLSGREAGVKFLLFEPKPTRKKQPEVAPGAPPAKSPGGKAPPTEATPEDFYDEIPIKVKFEGSFHNTVSFYAEVAKLPRIVNVEEFIMGDAKDVEGKGRMVQTACTMKTYMFVDKKE
jgi:type IV pilus assembly protein PilO